MLEYVLSLLDWHPCKLDRFADRIEGYLLHKILHKDHRLLVLKRLGRRERNSEEVYKFGEINIAKGDGSDIEFRVSTCILVYSLSCA